MQRYEPANHYELEYSIMPLEGVPALVNLCVTQYKDRDLGTWLKHYKRAGGSYLFGGEVMDSAWCMFITALPHDYQIYNEIESIYLLMSSA